MYLSGILHTLVILAAVAFTWDLRLQCLKLSLHDVKADEKEPSVHASFSAPLLCSAHYRQPHNDEKNETVSLSNSMSWKGLVPHLGGVAVPRLPDRRDGRPGIWWQELPALHMTRVFPKIQLHHEFRLERPRPHELSKCTTEEGG